MPKIVDHDLERTRLAEAAWRTIAREGLEGTTLRAVAREARCSTGPLAHYFGDKNRLLVHALRHAAHRTGARMAAHLQSRRGVAALRALLAEALPLDEARRAEWRIWLSFWGRAVTDPDLAAEQTRRYAEWRGLVRAALVGCRAERELAATVDLDREAEGIVALIDGIGIQAMFEPSRFPRARQLAMLATHLARIARPPARR